MQFMTAGPAYRRPSSFSFKTLTSSILFLPEIDDKSIETHINESAIDIVLNIVQFSRLNTSYTTFASLHTGSLMILWQISNLIVWTPHAVCQLPDL